MHQNDQAIETWLIVIVSSINKSDIYDFLFLNNRRQLEGGYLQPPPLLLYEECILLQLT
jgi:hypothetical protein